MTTTQGSAVTQGSSSGALLGVHADLGWTLATVLRVLVRQADASLTGFPGGTRGYRLLATVATDCPSSQLVLAQQTGLDRTVVTYLVDDLEAAGLVERQADPADRRTRRVVATGLGLTTLVEMQERLRLVEDHVLGGIDPAENAALRSLLQRVALRVTDGGAAPTCPGMEALVDEPGC